VEVLMASPYSAILLEVVIPGSRPRL